jgi:dTDP-4-amino-4,6-dideoxygalactose transaminase
MIRDHGQSRKYHHLVEGYNGRLDALQAALLRVKLPFLAEWNAQRRALAAEYNNLLKDIDSVQTPFEPEWSRANYHLYVVLCTKGRDQIQKHLTASNIATGLHYPIPLHLQPAYAYLGSGEGSLPETERLAGSILSLPMYPQLQREQQHRVAETLQQFSESQVVGNSIR